MDQDPSRRRRHLPPRSASGAMSMQEQDLAVAASLSQSQRRNPALVQSAASMGMGSRSVSGYASGFSSYQTPSPSAARDPGAAASTGVGGNSGGQVRSFSQTSHGAFAPGNGGSSDGRARLLSQTTYLGLGDGSASSSSSQSRAGIGGNSGVPLPSFSQSHNSVGAAGGSRLPSGHHFSPSLTPTPARHARSYSQSQTTMRSRPSNFQIPPFSHSHTRSSFSSASLGSGSASLSTASSRRDPSFLGHGLHMRPRRPQSAAATLVTSSEYELPPLPPSLPHVKREDDYIYSYSDAPTHVSSSGDVVILDHPEDVDIVSQYIDLDRLCGVQNSGEVIKQEPDIAGADKRGKAAMTTNDTCFNAFMDIETKPKQVPSLSTWIARDGASSSMCRGPSVTAMHGHGGLHAMAFADGSFTADEINKIMVEERLKELVLSNPKRVKKILRNRLSAKLSKERRFQHVVDLQRRVQQLEMEADTLSAQVESLQKKSDDLTSENNELKIKLQAMEQQTKLTNALNEVITSEVNHLKWAASGINGSYYMQQEKLQIQSQSSSKPQQAQEPLWNHETNVLQDIFGGDFT